MIEPARDRRGRLDAEQHPEIVARELLGWTIACRGTAAVLTELEAYHQDEPAAHSFGGRPTERTKGLFGPPGTAYVYVSYGIHRCANLVTGPDGSGEAVLLRSAMPVAGAASIRSRRAAGRGIEPSTLRARDLLTGPGRLAQGLDIRLQDTGRPILRAGTFELDEALEAATDGPIVCCSPAAAAAVGFDVPVDPSDVLVGPRIGITKAVELPWRFGIREAHVSKPFPRHDGLGGS